MLRNIFACIILSLILTSCFGYKTRRLEGGKGYAATNPKVYSNKSKFDKSLLSQIDTTVIYEQYRPVVYSGLNPTYVDVVSRKHNFGPHPAYGVYRFYNNGCFSNFSLSKKDSVLKKEMFNPNRTGLRGVYYKDDEIIKADLIGVVSDMGQVGKIKKTFTFKGDTLFVLGKKSKMEYIYVKRKIPLELLNFSADW